jgi:hypothetical protein
LALTGTRRVIRFPRKSQTALVLTLALTTAYDVATRMLSVLESAWWKSNDRSVVSLGGSSACVGAHPLRGPFDQNGDRGWTITIPSLLQFSDRYDPNSDLHFILCENGLPLGPARSSTTSIKEMGKGRYLHLDADLLFSTSDGSNPNFNAQHYSIRIAK